MRLDEARISVVTAHTRDEIVCGQKCGNLVRGLTGFHICGVDWYGWRVFTFGRHNRRGVAKGGERFKSEREEEKRAVRLFGRFCGVLGTRGMALCSLLLYIFMP